MAEEEPSVLQQIRRKEVELSVKTDQARQDAEQVVADAAREAAQILKKAESDGKKAAENYSKERLAEVLSEVEDLRHVGTEEAELTRQSGEQHLSEAVEKIVKAVIPE
ncbi:MAG TPA: V-type ATPase subunit subunit G family protein [Candidatus Bathyarchaeia archaeon]|nr:V-type ATPase subunit subunit G family protein [Candidatus Bathyarchaeia archaeon]